jgi:hypothetical protein
MAKFTMALVPGNIKGSRVSTEKCASSRREKRQSKIDMVVAEINSVFCNHINPNMTDIEYKKLHEKLVRIIKREIREE